MKKIAQIEFYENTHCYDSCAASTTRLYDDQGQLIHGNDFPAGLMDKISGPLRELSDVFGKLQ